jgi:imidazolonepropionase-like amidohydrolase
MARNPAPFLALTALAAALAAPLHAQEPAAPPATPVAKPAEAPLPVTAIVGGDVWTVTKGVIKRGTVIIRGAKIDKVGGPDLAIPDGATVIDARGRVVAPGLIVPSTASGLVRAGGGQLKDALDPYALPVSLALASGVTCVYTAGGGGAAGGEEGGAQSGLASSNAIVKMAEGDASAMLMKEPADLTFTGGRGGGGGRRGGLGRFGGGGGGAGQLSARYNLRELLQRAKDYQEKQDAWEKGGKKGAAPRKPQGIDDALALIKKERILRVTASEVSDIRWALGLVDDFGVKQVIYPATEAWIIADEIAKRDVLLIISARTRVPGDDRANRPTGSNPDAAGILQKAGVRFAVVPSTVSFSTGGELGRDLLTYPLEAAYAIRGGMTEQGALEALTITAARILGVESRIGSIEEGKDADLVIFSDDPLDYRSFAEKTFVNGKLLYDKDRSTFFSYVKSRTLPPADPPAPAPEGPTPR